MTLKAQILALLSADFGDKLQTIQQDLEGLREELSDNTKSTAGDKHETSRAMAQLEMEKLGKQYIETQKKYELVKQLSALPPLDIANVGALIFTSKGVFLLGIPVGKIVLEEQEVFGISASSPVGQLLLGKAIGDQVKLPLGETQISLIQ